METAGEEFKDELKAVFEPICDGLGEALCEDEASFKMVKADFSAAETEAFAKALCPKYFEIENEE